MFCQCRSFTISANAATPRKVDQGLEFPYVSVPHKKVMVDLVSTVEDSLGSQLLPCTLPHDARSYRSKTGTSQASLHIRKGHQSSPVDLMLGSWIHSELPRGGELNITSVSMYLKPSSDAPNFAMDLIRSGPTSAVLILDLPPRKDPVLHPDYLTTFYENTNLESHRRELEKLPEIVPYFSPSLYVRAFVSPTAILVRIEAEEEERMEDIIRDHVGPVSKEVIKVWLDRCCAYGYDEAFGKQERDNVRARDEVMRRKTIESDLAVSLPRLFGQETADRFISTVGEYFFSS